MLKNVVTECGQTFALFNFKVSVLKEVQVRNSQKILI